MFVNCVDQVGQTFYDLLSIVKILNSLVQNTDSMSYIMDAAWDISQIKPEPTNIPEDVLQIHGFFFRFYYCQWIRWSFRLASWREETKENYSHHSCQVRLGEGGEAEEGGEWCDLWPQYAGHLNCEKNKGRVALRRERGWAVCGMPDEHLHLPHSIVHVYKGKL